jgi:hypothetical protein
VRFVLLVESATRETVLVFFAGREDGWTREDDGAGDGRSPAFVSSSASDRFLVITASIFLSCRFETLTSVDEIC